MTNNKNIKSLLTDTLLRMNIGSLINRKNSVVRFSEDGLYVKFCIEDEGGKFKVGTLHVQETKKCYKPLRYKAMKKEVIRLKKKRLTNKAIANELDISLNTVVHIISEYNNTADNKI